MKAIFLWLVSQNLSSRLAEVAKFNLPDDSDDSHSPVFIYAHEKLSFMQQMFTEPIHEQLTELVKSILSPIHV